MEQKPILVAGLRDYSQNANEILQLLGGKAELLPITEKEFPDGERYHRIDTSPLNRDVLLVCGTPTDAHFLDLIDVACAAAKYGAKSLSLLIPYFGYSTMERNTKKGEVVKAKVRARMLSAIPQAKTGNSILFLDLHSEGLPYYIEGDTRVHHIYSEALMAKTISENIKEDFVMASTDAGRAKWVQSYANRLGTEASFCLKERLDGDRTELKAVAAHVEGQHVVIYDDMIRTGGSLLEAAKAYKTAGAKSIDVATTHGIFPNNSLQKIFDSGLVGKIIVSDSLPKVYNLQKEDPNRFHILPLAPGWAEVLSIHYDF